MQNGAALQMLHHSAEKWKRCEHYLLDQINLYHNISHHIICLKLINVSHKQTEPVLHYSVVLRPPYITCIDDDRNEAHIHEQLNISHITNNGRFTIMKLKWNSTQQFKSCLISCISYTVNICHCLSCKSILIFKAQLSKFTQRFIQPNFTFTRGDTISFCHTISFCPSLSGLKNLNKWCRKSVPIPLFF